MSKAFTLTKEEFIKRSMNNEVFIHDKNEFFYDRSKENPFRMNDYPLEHGWCYFDNNLLFTLKQSIERRWRWLQDLKDSTLESQYMSDEKAKYFLGEAWHKKEDDYIDVEIPNENT